MFRALNPKFDILGPQRMIRLGLVVTVEQSISLCSQGENCFSTDTVTYLQLCIRVLSCSGSQPAMK